jgi:rSAM/selenodomain-associated transferase 2
MISIVTPVYNEKENIEPFLLHLNAVRGDFELIVVDGASTDGTPEEVARVKERCGYPVRVVACETGKSAQMNRGAAASLGETILFLHVDCLIPPGALEAIGKGMDDPNIVGGGFSHTFTDRDLLLQMTSAFGNVLAKTTQTFFGDFGIFMRKDAFQQAGGYDIIPFLEDVELCRRAKSQGRLVQLDVPILSSSRRYRLKGRATLTAVYILAILLNIAGIRPSFLVRYIVDR